MVNATREYQAPLNDLRFLVNEFSPSASEDLFFVLEQAAKFAEEKLAPINQLSDEQGCRFDNGKVYLPECMRDAFQDYANGGWMGMAMPEQYGGQGLPEWAFAGVSEMLTSANHAFSMMPALTMSACRALINHGSGELKETYLHKMIAGEWTGTMCLTEAHCGSDLGMIRSTARLSEEGSYLIKGTKIFISSGQHDASDNIIHLVLARAEGAPKGIKGLSLFLVPAKLRDDTGQWVLNNQVECIGIEKKMGIHGSPTCTMSFDSAEGYLVGDIHRGINAMFTMMNEMRLGTSLQGVGLCERSYQKSLQYAADRTQMRSLSGVKSPDKEADSIIVHPDVRRMLLTQKVFAEGGRALSQYCAELLQHEHDGTANAEQSLLLNMLTPIAKGFCTEVGLESASHAIQIFGGHGFIQESGVEQLYRDGRIATLYEGTTGIQALDLLGRKVLGAQGKNLRLFTKEIHLFCRRQEDSQTLRELIKKLHELSKEWPEVTMHIGTRAMRNADEVGAASVDYLMYSGYVTLAYFWARMAVSAESILSENNEEKINHYGRKLLEAKVSNARFYFSRILPRAQSHKAVMMSDMGAIVEEAGLPTDI